MEIPVLQEEIDEARDYARRASPYTLKKLDRQRPKVAGRQNAENQVNFRVARAVVSRLLIQSGIVNVCDDSSHTDTTSFCIRTVHGALIQVRFITDRPNYLNLLEDIHSFTRRPHDLYVATTSSNQLRSIRIHGFATRTELSRLKPKDFGQAVMNRYVPLTQLHPMPQLLVILKRHDWKTAAEETLNGA